MVRDGFVEFVQWTFFEDKNGSKVSFARSRSAEITTHLLWNAIDCAIGARGLYKNQLAI